MKKSLDLVAKDEESYDLWVNGLIRIISKVKDEEHAPEELTYRYPFLTHSTSNTLTIVPVKHMRKLLDIP